MNIQLAFVKKNSSSQYFPRRQISTGPQVLPTRRSIRWHGTRTASLSNRHSRVVFEPAVPSPLKTSKVLQTHKHLPIPAASSPSSSANTSQPAKLDNRRS